MAAFSSRPGTSGAWAMARPLTAKMAVDFNMVFLMATPAAFTLQGDVRDTVGRAVAVVVGVLAATIFFHATHEPPPRRLARLARGALRDLRSIAPAAMWRRRGCGGVCWPTGWCGWPRRPRRTPAWGGLPRRQWR